MYDEEETIEEKSFKVGEDDDSEMFDDDLNDPLDPIDENTDFGFNEEEPELE